MKIFWMVMVWGVIIRFLIFMAGCFRLAIRSPRMKGLGRIRGSIRGGFGGLGHHK